MSREIKFRAWVDSYSYWHMTDSVTIGNDGVFFHVGRSNITNPDWKLLQYTGLKDKNGKEIYEGDIWEGYKNFVVKYNEYYAGFEPFVTDGGCGCCSDDETGKTPENGEVIGNIYENPELLEESQ